MLNTSTLWMQRYRESKLKVIKSALDVHHLSLGPPGVLGIWGELLFIFRELGSTGYY